MSGPAKGSRQGGSNHEGRIKKLQGHGHGLGHAAWGRGALSFPSCWWWHWQFGMAMAMACSTAAAELLQRAQRRQQQHGPAPSGKLLIIMLIITVGRRIFPFPFGSHDSLSESWLGPRMHHHLRDLPAALRALHCICICMPRLLPPRPACAYFLGSVLFLSQVLRREQGFPFPPLVVL